MKNIVKNKGIAILLVILTFFGCQEEDRTFDETPTARKNASVSKLKSLLVSVPGYRVVYFPKNTVYGGFLFYMSFDEEGNVKMTGNVDDDIDFVQGQYDVKSVSATELVFTTLNQIHKLSNNRTPGLIGSGYEGHSQFQFNSVDESGNITFSELRSKGIMIFEPVDQATLDNAVSLMGKSRKFDAMLSGEDPNLSVYQTLSFNVNGKDQAFDLNFGALKQYATPYGITEEYPSGGSYQAFGVAFTSEGIEVSPEVSFDSVPFAEFDYNEETNSFVSENSGSTATISFANGPAFITNDVLDIGIKFNRFLYQPTLGTNPLTSAGFDALIDEVNKNLSVFSVRFSLLSIYVDQNEPGLSILEISASGNLARYAYNTEIKDSKFYMKYAGPDNSIGAILEPHLEPLRSFFGSSKGLYYTNEGSFKSDDNNYSNSSCTFTSAESPNIRLYGLWY